MKTENVKKTEIDWYAVIIPLLGVVIISILFMVFVDFIMRYLD